MSDLLFSATLHRYNDLRSPLKAFISERKPRNLTRKPLKAKDPRTDQTDRRPEESGPIEDLKSISVADLNGQESSSQSSADNGDPQTPSPLYSKPTVNSDATGIQLGDLDTESVNDPALRRLLVALTSSSVRSDTSNIDRSKPQPSVPSTIVPAAVVKSHTPPEVDAAHDWSMRGPRWPTEKLTDSRPHRTPSPSSSENEVPMQSSPMQSSPNTSRRTSRPASLSTRNDRTKSPAHASPPTSGTFATLSLMPSSRPTARRGSASATDLSPYLTRPSEAPAIGKRMKQLALLESVIDESSRMTPVLGFRAPAVPVTTNSHIQRPPVSYGMGTTPPPHPHARPPSVSAAQPTHPNNLSSIYNVHGPYHPQPQIFNPHNHGPPGMPGDDPFTVRPRTSNTFRPVADNFSRPLQTRASMNQAQLLSALSGPLGTQRPPVGLPGSAHPPPIPHQAVMRGMNPSAMPLHAGPNSSSKMGPVLPPPPLHMTPAHFMPGPTSAPAISPNFNVSHPPPQSNATLLSILNRGPGVPTNGSWSGATQRGNF